MKIFLEIFGSDFQALVIASAATVELNFIKSDLTKESSRFFLFFLFFGCCCLSHARNVQVESESLFDL